MTNVLGSENEFPIIRILEDPTPPLTPASGVYYLYVDEATKTLHGKDDTGDDIDYGASGSAYSPGGTDVAVADGGTGASTAAAARTNLGAQATISDIEGLPTAETDDTLVLAPDGAGGVEWRAETGGSGGGNLVPTLIQRAGNGANTTSLAVTIAAASSGHRIVVIVGSNARDVNTPTCTNVTFTEVLPVTFGGTVWLSVYVGVVAGGASGTTVTITATGSNFIFAEAIEVADALTPTAGTSATLTDTDATASTAQGATDCRIAPTRGTFVIYAAFQGTNTTLMTLGFTGPFTSGRVRSSGALVYALAYAPGGSVGGWTLSGTSGADYCAGIVAVT